MNDDFTPPSEESQTLLKTNWRRLHDYGMSWDFYRALCVEHGEPDPGPLAPPEPTPKMAELEARIAKLEEGHYTKLARAVVKAAGAERPKFKGVSPI